MDVQSLAHMQQFDKLLRVQDLQLYGVETIHRQTKQPGSSNFDESLPASRFEMTLAGGAKRGWVSKTDLLAAGYLDDARRKLKETDQMERNGKRTVQGIPAGNKKRTAQGIAVENKKRTALRKRNNTNRVPRSRRMRRSYVGKGNVRSSASSMIITAKSCWWN
jgi:hypothetical protein